MFDKLPKGVTLATSKIDYYFVDLGNAKVEELRQLVKLSIIGPATYENRNADPSAGKFGLSKFGVTREWLADAQDEWQAFDW